MAGDPLVSKRSNSINFKVETARFTKQQKIKEEENKQKQTIEHHSNSSLDDFDLVQKEIQNKLDFLRSSEDDQ